MDGVVLSNFISFNLFNRLGILQAGPDAETGAAHPRATGHPRLLPALLGEPGRLSQNALGRQDSPLRLQEHVAGHS